MRRGLEAAIRGSGIAACLSALALLACSPAPRSPQEEIREIVVSMASAVEEKRTHDILRHVSVSFRSRAEAGRPTLDYGDLQSLVLEFLLTEETLGAAWFMRGRRLAGSRDPLPPGATGYRLELDFARREGAWLVVTGAYAPLGEPASAPEPSSTGSPTTTAGTPAISTRVPGSA
jgi:hypothetical protein